MKIFPDQEQGLLQTRELKQTSSQIDKKLEFQYAQGPKAI